MEAISHNLFSDEHPEDLLEKIIEDGVTQSEFENVYRISDSGECNRDAFLCTAIQNSQRDINIAFMNELSIIFNKMGIDTKAVLEAAGTKWNFLKFSPGLVGGHCIGVDPYYLTYKAEELGYHSQIILAGRRINDGIPSQSQKNTAKSGLQHGF